jgi:hypothetical protein
MSCTRNWLPLLVGALLATTSTVAEAGKNDPLDFNDLEAVREVGADYGFAAMSGVSKKTGIPHKVAIGGFQVQYTLRTQEFGDGDRWYLRLADDDYQKITDAMYDAFVVSLGEHGFEVVGKEAVVAAPTYQRLKGEEAAVEKNNKVIFPATGMKFLKAVPGGGLPVPNLWYFPAINSEVGSDSLLFVTANIALCEVKLKGEPPKTIVCTGPVAEYAKSSIGQYSGFSAAWYHGGKEGGRLPGAEFNTWQAAGVSTMGKYGTLPWGSTDATVRQTVKRGLFSSTSQASADAYVDNALDLWDTVLYMTWAQWDAAMEKPLKKLSGE